MKELPSETIEMLGKVAKNLRECDPETRRVEQERAKLVLASLVQVLPEVENANTLATVAYVISTIIASFLHMTPIDLAETLDNSMAAYGLAAAHLAKLYDVNEEVKDDVLRDDNDRVSGRYGYL